MGESTSVGGTSGTAAPAGDVRTGAKHVLEVFGAAVGAADPAAAVRKHLTLEDDALVVTGLGGKTRVPLPRGRVLVVGAGKGSAPMGQALEEVLGSRIEDGLICVKDGHGCPLERIRLREASHPVPDQRGVKAAEEILRLVEGAGKEDLVLGVLSGGGSALLTLPAEGVSLEDLQELTDQLLSCGASIDEINALRKHLSRVKGGRLAAAAHPARVVNLMLSDVVGDRVDVIASGPFTADPSTYGEAMGVLQRYGLEQRVPAAVREVLGRGSRGEIAETPKPGDPSVQQVTHAVVGSNRISLEAAGDRARELGYRPLILSSLVEGEAREVARVLAAVAKECRLTGVPVAAPACLLAGGETTVTLRGGGKGGRNQELALAMALELEDWDGIVGLSGGTDGTDGPTDAAGAVARPDTVSRGRSSGLEARTHLESNDSYNYFDRLGDLVRTGPTRTNVMDIQILLIS